MLHLVNRTQKMTDTTRMIQIKAVGDLAVRLFSRNGFVLTVLRDSLESDVQPLTIIPSV